MNRDCPDALFRHQAGRRSVILWTALRPVQHIQQSAHGRRQHTGAFIEQADAAFHVRTVDPIVDEAFVRRRAQRQRVADERRAQSVAGEIVGRQLLIQLQADMGCKAGLRA